MAEQNTMNTSIGKVIRLKRLIQRESNSCIIFAIDHGMTAPQFLDGLYETKTRVRQAISGGAHVLMMGRGVAQDCADEFRRDTALAFMLSASAAGRPAGAVITPNGSVQEALRFGADAVVVYAALAGDDEAQMVTYLAQVGEQCEQLGMPFIAEAEYPNAYQSLTTMSDQYGVEYLKRNARLCAELGADIVKVNWAGSQAACAEVVRACGRPVVLAGGSLLDDAELLTRMEQARAAGAIGCSVGRNIFQHPKPEAITRALTRIFRDKWAAREALEELETA